VTRFSPGLCSVTFRHLNPVAVVDAARKAGLAAIEWGGDIHVPQGDVETARRIRAITEEAGMRPASYGSYVDPPRSDAAQFDLALRSAVALGAGNMRIWAGTRGRPSADYTARERSRAATLIRAMAHAAGRLGITISLECHPDSLTDDTDSAADLIEEIAHGNVYLCWQPRPGLPLCDAVAQIERLGSRISHVHVFAWNENRDRFPLASQERFWREIFRAIPAPRFPRPRYALLEFVEGDRLDTFEDDAATLLRLLAEAEHS
jgi:sugar phosphate isomerase/epimerase